MVHLLEIYMKWLFAELWVMERGIVSRLSKYAGWCMVMVCVWASIGQVWTRHTSSLQPRLPHDLHRQLSSMIVRVTQTVLCSSSLPSSLDVVRVGLLLLGSGHCRLWTEFGA